ncbi:MAG: hypothetical protein WD096_06880 [Actinomycetota bacterium]
MSADDSSARRKGLGGEWAVRPNCKIIASLVLATASGLVFTAPASAALCARWDPPPQADEGTQVLVSFRTFVPVSTTGDDYTLEPHAFPDYPFRVQAVAPNGTISVIRMYARSDDERVWTGSFTPSQEGAWTLTIANLQGGDAACSIDATLSVEKGSGINAASYVLIALGVIVVGLAGFELVRRRRSHAESPT